MIIEQSQINFKAEHEKRESVMVSRSAGIELKGEQFSTAFSEYKSLFASQQESSLSFMAGAGVEQVSSDQGQESDSIMVMTEEGFKFRTAEEREADFIKQQEITRARLFQQLIDAISRRWENSVPVKPIELPDQQGVSETPNITNGQPAQFKPITLEMTLNLTETVEEYECSQFSSCGYVSTADGRQIDFSLAMTMERSYTETRELQITQEVVFTDPLVLNFEGDAIDLDQNQYSFDLNADGEEELINLFSSDTAWLALDKNEDGIINDGSELFGALTGNGFAELAEYDEDGNQFIDEADSIFADLLLWKPGAGEDALASLLDQDVGAIYLGSTETPFSVKGENNEHQAQVKSSGVYLTESGEVGSVQQLDMVV